MHTIHLQWPPSINNYYAQGARSGKFISKKGRLWRQGAIDDIHEQIDFSSGLFPLSGRLSVKVLQHAPDRRKRDLDNYIKPLFDAITHSGLWVDDELIDYFAVKRGKIAATQQSGKVIVQIEGF